MAKMLDIARCLFTVNREACGHVVPMLDSTNRMHTGQNDDINSNATYFEAVSIGHPRNDIGQIRGLLCLLEDIVELDWELVRAR
jgi:hypothetical protein